MANKHMNHAQCYQIIRGNANKNDNEIPFHTHKYGYSQNIGNKKYD